MQVVVGERERQVRHIHGAFAWCQTSTHIVKILKTVKKNETHKTHHDDKGKETKVFAKINNEKAKRTLANVSILRLNIMTKHRICGLK